MDIHTKSNPLDLAFTNSRHGFLVGSSILAASDMEAQVKQLVYGRVKICGITRRADAQAALEAGNLVRPFGLSIPSRWNYYMRLNRSGPAAHAAQAFAQWIRQQLEAGSA